MEFAANTFTIKNKRYYYIVLLYNNGSCIPGTNKPMLCSVYTSEVIVMLLSRYIDIQLYEYINILRSCGAILTDSNLIGNELAFNNENNIQQVLEILNEKYMIMIKLLGVK